MQNKNKKNKNEAEESLKAIEKDAKNLAIKESMDASGQSEPQAGCSSSTIVDEDEGIVFMNSYTYM